MPQNRIYLYLAAAVLSFLFSISASAADEQKDKDTYSSEFGNCTSPLIKNMLFLSVC